MLANTLPLAVDVTDDPGFATLVRRMNTVVLGALEHQDVTFEQLVADSGHPRDASRNPLSQVMYQCIESREHVWELPGVTVERERIGMASAKVDLSLVAANLDEGVRLDLVGESTLFEPATVERMLDSLVEVLTRAVAAPGTAVGEVDLLSAADRAQVVDGFNRTGATPPDGTRPLVCALAILDAAACNRQGSMGIGRCRTGPTIRQAIAPRAVRPIQSELTAELTCNE
jgi:non-ribosomal peptide synthetase component F